MIPQILWFKRDLRVHDHEALKLCGDAPVIPLYIVEPDLWKQPDASRRHWHFIYDCLLELQEDLADLGAPLMVLQGEAVEVLTALKQKYGFFTLISHEETGNAWSFQRDIAVANWCAAEGVDWLEIPSHGVVRRLKSRDKWAKLRDERMSKSVLEKPLLLKGFEREVLGFLPDKNASLFRQIDKGAVQSGGRRAGVKTLTSFLLKRGANYMQTISKPGVSARNCSRLSPHIAFGTLSVKEIEQATKRRIMELDDPYFKRNLVAFLSRLAWRCHFVQKLEQQPAIETHCMHTSFEGMRDNFNEIYFKAWCEGKTGYPLIDASMRSLHENGWITFRMRAMLVSFASYHLWLDWRRTAPFLACLFTDYEPGIHYSQFQMQSGVTGINAVRMYSPVKQSTDHDPDGVFIRRFVPELREVHKAFIHEPWRLEKDVGYPKPLVAHKEAVQFAKAKISQYRRTDEFREQAQAVFNKLGSRKKQARAIRIKHKQQGELF